MKFGLRNIRSLLASVSNPESKFPSIHIAGTNGKGSTAAFLSSIMMEAGYRTGLYTSPHLVRFTERIRINGREITGRRLVHYVTALRPAIEKVRATFFEATTCVAFQFFADEGVDIAIIEVGLGGRLDSTNTVIPMASVITNVGLDHTEVLGRTLRAIAREKAGIIKRHVPCITTTQDTAVIDVLRDVARVKNAKLYEAPRVVTCVAGFKEPRTVTFRSASLLLRNVRPGLTGLHQVSNAQVAVATVEVLRRGRQDPPFLKKLTGESVRKGLENVVKNSGLHGRFDQAGRSSRYILDVAHNPDGVSALVRTLRSRGQDNLVVVFGVMKDKDYSSMIRELAPVSRTIVAVEPSIKRALSAAALYRSIRKQGISTCCGGTVRKGILAANQWRKNRSPVLITGSHYVVGEALQFLKRKRA